MIGTVVGYILNLIVQAAFASQILDDRKKVKVENSAFEQKETGAVAEKVTPQRGSN